MTLTIPRLVPEKDNFYDRLQLTTLTCFMIATGAAFPILILRVFVQTTFVQTTLLPIILWCWIPFALLTTFLIMVTTIWHPDFDQEERAARKTWVAETYGLHLGDRQIDNLFHLGTHHADKVTELAGFNRYGSTHIPGYKHTIEAVVADPIYNAKLGSGVHLVEADPNGMKELEKR